MEIQPSLEAATRNPAWAEQLFDRIPDVVFFIKDTLGRYVRVNRTLVSRCGAVSKRDLIGRTAREVFPTPLGERFLEQDLEVVATGTPVSQNLELHLYPTRIEGWCLTDKLPLWGDKDVVAGLAGISRDLPQAAESGEVAAVIDYARTHIGEDLRVDELAAVAGLSVYQLNRRLRKILEITASRLVTKTRIDAASRMLRAGAEPIASIAHSCGYYDQSAFSRVFRRTVGLTPQQYRARHRT